MASSQMAPGLSRKVKKILEIKTESHDMITALNTLSCFYDENTPHARRALRSTIEKRGLEIHEQFLGSAELAIQALDGVQDHLDVLSSSCNNISSVLSAAKQVAAPLISDMERLQKDLDAVEQKGKLIGEFLDQYQLGPDEVSALQGEEVGPMFFTALARVRQIHENCRSLLRSHHQRAGLELMDMMATYQETAYERLCRWVQGECRSIGEFDAPEVDLALQAAVGALRERPVLFKYCAEEVATARHNALFQRFITALTRGGPGGMPRPIEIHAHDPKRYISDMLAWVHQALAGEREFVFSLFGDDKAATVEDAKHSSSGGSVSDDSMSSTALLDRIFESICRPLKVRIEQVLMTSPPLLLCFQLAQLHSFYTTLVAKAIGQGAHLSSALRSCRDMASRVFFEQLKGKGDKLLKAPPSPPRDLSPPPQVSETIHQLLEIVSAYETALETTPTSTSALGTSSASQDGPVDSELGPVLAAVLDPLVEACERSAEALLPDAPSRVDEFANLDPTAHRVYLINCLVPILNGLSTRRSVAARARQVSDMIEGHLSSLVDGEAARLLARCGLGEVLERMKLYRGPSAARPAEGSGLPSSDPELSLARISEAMRGFFIMISSPDALPEFRKIQAPRMRADAVSRAARTLVDAYDALYQAVDDPTSGYLEQGGSSAIKHDPVQVRTILGVL